MKRGLIFLKWLILSAVFISWSYPHHTTNAKPQPVRSAAVAGQFYENDPIQLSQTIHQLLERESVVSSGSKIIGIVVPHAGYAFSAATAASAYRQAAEQQVDVIVVFAPSHRDYFQGATITPCAAYETPLGLMPVDHTIVEKIVSQNENIRISSLGHQAEHAVEVQIPFLQVLFPRAVLVPIVLGKITDYHEAESIAADIANSLQGKRVLLVASTDLYHGYSYSECVAVNKRTVAAFTALQPRKLFDGLETGQYQACGGHAVVMMENVALALGARTAELLKLTNSNDVIGERGSYVVGYSSVMVTTGSASRSHEEKVEFKPLPIETQKTLLQHARMAIAEYMSNSNIITINTPDSLLQQRRGVFVTLTKDGQLRGCIGYHETDIPLSRLVPQMAVAAAFEDPRFPPLSKNEMDRVKIKISVYLTNIYPIKSIKEFQMGRDGIILRKNGYSATFLPEVPLEAGWKTVEDELKSLCLKAGLPPDAWHEGAEFWIYRTQVFDESIMKY